MNHYIFFQPGFARSFCSVAKKEAIEVQLKTDSHSPDHLRINLALANMPAFAEAFKCSPTDALARVYVLGWLKLIILVVNM